MLPGDVTMCTACGQWYLERKPITKQEAGALARNTPTCSGAN